MNTFAYDPIKDFDERGERAPGGDDFVERERQPPFGREQRRRQRRDWRRTYPPPTKRTHVTSRGCRTRTLTVPRSKRVVYCRVSASVEEERVATPFPSLPPPPRYHVVRTWLLPKRTIAT